MCIVDSLAVLDRSLPTSDAQMEVLMSPRLLLTFIASFVVAAAIRAPTVRALTIYETYLHGSICVTDDGAGGAALMHRSEGPLCQRRMRQLPLDISVVMGGEWGLLHAEAVPCSWS